jgi:hypothetical protein
MNVAQQAKKAGMIAAVVAGAVAGSLGYFKGDDAQVDVASILEQLNVRVAKQEAVINAQSEKLEKLSRRMVFFQAHQAGFRAGALYEQTQELEERIKTLRAEKRRPAPKVLNTLRGDKRPAKVEPPRPAPAPKPAPAQQEQQAIPRLFPKPFKKGK